MLTRSTFDIFISIATPLEVRAKLLKVSSLTVLSVVSLTPLSLEGSVPRIQYRRPYRVSNEDVFSRSLYTDGDTAYLHTHRDNGSPRL